MVPRKKNVLDAFVIKPMIRIAAEALDALLIRDGRNRVQLSADYPLRPWRLSPNCQMLASTQALGAPHIVIFHFVVDGTARACVESGPDIELSPADFVVFPHGNPHHLSGGTGTNHVESTAVLRRIAIGDLSPMHAGGGGATTRLEQSILHLLEEAASDGAVATRCWRNCPKRCSWIR